MHSTHELTGRLTNVSFSWSGKPLITIEFNEKESAVQMFDDLKNADKVSVGIKKFRQKRSLDANAYFHVLVNEIAKKMRISDDEAKKLLVRRYGTLAKDEDGNYLGAMLPASADPEAFYPYCRSYKTVFVNGKECTCYLFYKRTRELDTAEMSHLINGTVDEAQALGIQTRPQEEIDSLLSSWR